MCIEVVNTCVLGCVVSFGLMNDVVYCFAAVGCFLSCLHFFVFLAGLVGCQLCNFVGLVVL